MDPLELARRIAAGLNGDGEPARLAGELVRLLEAAGRPAPPTAALQAIVGENPAFRRALELLQRVAPTAAPVLLEGESGTGKELFARALHDLSPRRERPFVAINCAAVPETLLESELFGHVRGAFTGANADVIGRFEAAHGGTLFLDEVSEMSPGLQSKLLRALQDGEIQPVGAPHSRRVDTRVVCATNRRLEDLMSAGRFREDLYYRLCVVALRLPPLRDRRDDLPALIHHFLEADAADFRKAVIGFDRDATRRLLAHDYPGNVRELHNVIRHAVLMAEGPVAGLGDLPEYVRPPARDPGPADAPRTAAELRRAKTRAREEVERAFVTEALRRAKGSVAKAARETGVHRTRLAQLIRRYGIDPASFR